MIILTEGDISALATPADAFKAVEGVYKAVARNEATNYPVVREACGQSVFGVKSGFDAAAPALGLKAGGYWPGNAAKGLTNHQSAAILFNPDTGRADALLSGNLITALRTAAACAVSIAHLSRQNSRCLGVIGAGAQVKHHIQAAIGVRPFEKVVIWNRNPAKAQQVAQSVEGICPDIEVADSIDMVASQADVIVTLTPATNPLLQPQMVRAGTHIAAMGSDTAGKQEIAEALMAQAKVFVDSEAQSRSIGERQYLQRDPSAPDALEGLIGDVLLGNIEGRNGESEITLFDSTGIALQDIALARMLVERAREHKVGVEVDF